MKQITLITIFSVALLAACNSDTKQPDAGGDNHQSTTPITSNESTNQSSFEIKEVLSSYLQMKNALANDNANDAASAGNAMVAAFGKFDKSALRAEQKKTYEDIEEDAKEHAEHISDNGSNIKHQREHFETLSKDVYELVKAFGAGQQLYYTHCPMYNNNKGAEWLSETKEISNPYFGKEMLTCGKVKEELK